jgi:hypothetical protein
MYVRKAALVSSVSSIVHHFLSPSMDGVGYKLQPAGPGYESVWGATAVVPYLEALTAEGSLDAAFEAMAAHDQELALKLLGYLGAERQWRRGVRVVGDVGAGPAGRMPTVSFVVGEGDGGMQRALGSREVVRRVDGSKAKVSWQLGKLWGTVGNKLADTVRNRSWH